MTKKQTIQEKLSEDLIEFCKVTYNKVREKEKLDKELRSDIKQLKNLAQAVLGDMTYLDKYNSSAMSWIDSGDQDKLEKFYDALSESDRQTLSLRKITESAFEARLFTEKRSKSAILLRLTKTLNKRKKQSD